MTTVIQPIDTELKEGIESLAKGTYLDGECYAFAIGLNRGLGWPIVGFFRKDVPIHAGARSPDGKIYDVRGAMSDEQFCASHPANSPDHEEYIHPVSEDSLRKIRQIDESSIVYAELWAQMLWPELPWKSPYTSKVKAFADGLENLSRKHGLWIRSPLKTTPPMIAVTGDDEEGYTLELVSATGVFAIYRRLSGEF